ncbi:MAG: hypothetical protein WC838_00510 [Candidatus Margulisiibacteriota bacterium]|jgi:hypothetical protein
MPETILFISNGHGEDLIASEIIKQIRLAGSPIPTLSALPLVGSGRAFSENNIPILYPGRDLPSGGFVMTAKELWADLKAGWLKLTWQQWKALWKIRRQVQTVVAIGDTYPLLLSLLFTSSRKIFLSAAKSSYVGDHNNLELRITRRYIDLVFTRDQFTSDYLHKYGIHSTWVGNVMMDCLKITGETYNIEPNDLVIGILPGSRKEAYANLELINKVLVELRKRLARDKVFFLVAVASSLDRAQVDRILQHSEDVILADNLGDVINNSKVIIGLAGTANEQAIGLGKPVVAFPASGPQTSHYRFRLQNRLLGGAVHLLDEFDPRKASDAVLSLLVDKRKREEVAKTGSERMGPPGAAKKIAEIILSEIWDQA